MVPSLTDATSEAPIVISTLSTHVVSTPIFPLIETYYLPPYVTKENRTKAQTPIVT